MLEASGVPFTVDPARVDEAAVKETMRAQGAGAALVAETLAELKAIKISQKHPAALVLGADQTLDVDGDILDKPASPEEARNQLMRMSGGTHILPTAAVIAEDGRPVWRKVSSPRISFRKLSDVFIARHIDNMGDRAFGCVGACEVEGTGAQMIKRIDGDFFSVLGLPLLEVLDYLRLRNVLES